MGCFRAMQAKLMIIQQFGTERICSPSERRMQELDRLKEIGPTADSLLFVDNFLLATVTNTAISSSGLRVEKRAHRKFNKDSFYRNKNNKDFFCYNKIKSDQLSIQYEQIDEIVRSWNRKILLNNYH